MTGILLTFQNGEFVEMSACGSAFAFCIFSLCDNVFYNCHGRRGGFKFPQKILQRIRRSFKNTFQTGGSIAYPAADAKSSGKTMQKGAEPHPLYDPFYIQMNLQCLAFLRVHIRNQSFFMVSAIKSARSASPSPVRLLTRNSGASGLTVP